LRRFKRKVQQEDIIKELKTQLLHEAGEKRRGNKRYRASGCEEAAAERN